MNKLSKDRKKILELNRTYFRGDPLVSDSIYEEMLAEFKNTYDDLEFMKLDKLIKKLALLASEGRNLIKHPFRILDIKKTNDIEKIKNFIKERRFIIEPKLDGVFICILYCRGKLESCILKGDGIRGGDVTKQILPFIPSTIAEPFNSLEKIAIYAEILVRLSSFNNSNELKSTFANARSMVVSYVNSFERANKYDDLLTVIVHGIDRETMCSAFANDSLEIVLQKLSLCGFNVVPYITTPNPPSNEEEARECFKVDFDCDGLIFKYSSISEILENYSCGTINRSYYSYVMAFKFTTSLSTTVKEIHFTMNKFGIYVPIVEIEEINFNGMKCDRIQGYNAAFLNENGIGRGAIINVKHKVIFIFQNTIKKTTIDLLESCHHCRSKLVLDEVNLRCINKECSGLFSINIVHALKSLGLKNVAESKINHLISMGLLKDYADLFTLQKLDPLDPKYKTISACLKSFSQFNSLFKSLSDFLCFFNINGLGKANRKIIDDIYEDFEQMEEDARKDFIFAKSSQFHKNVCIQRFIDFFCNKENLNSLSEMISQYRKSTNTKD